MAAVTKGSGSYFHGFERVWTETRDSGVAPFYATKHPPWRELPSQPNPELMRAMCDGRAYGIRVQSNRVGCFDLTVSFGKSISLLAYGLTPPSGWKGWTEAFARAATPEVARLVSEQRMNSGPQGRARVPSGGIAVGFCHWKGYLGQPQAHIHFAIPNLTWDERGKAGSIANARELFEKQGLVRARANKGLDDELQSRGFETVRVGRKVELAGVPRGLIEELSPARRAMERAREEKQFSGPRAEDFYARQARRDAGPRVERTPEESHRDCTELARRHGVTLESLRKDAPAPPRDPAAAMSSAFHVAREAARACAKKHGSFTSDQFLERLYTLGIGRPATLEALDAMGKAALNDRSIAGICERRMPDGSVRYATRESAKADRAAERPYRGDTGEAWAALKGAARGLGEAVLIATARKATQVAERLAEAVNPPPRTLSVDASRLPEAIDRLSPTPYFLAHGKAILAGLKAGGNPHERAGAAERVYDALRSHERLPKNSVLIVERGSLASARELHLLARIARRDGASVVLSEREAGRFGRSQGAERADDRHARAREL